MNIIETLTHTPEARVEHGLFRVGMWWRTFYGVLRLILGFVLLKLVNTPFADVFYRLMSHEIIEDPSDLLISVVYPLIQEHSFTITYFIAAYLLFWGFIDVFFSIQLLRHKLWAFPVSIVLITLFVLYEIYRFTHTHSLFLLGVIVIDVVIIFLTYREYRRLQQNTQAGVLL